VYCQQVYLRGCQPVRLRQALAELPETLDETYSRTLRQINNADWDLAHRLFQCITVASRPLRVGELAEFLAFEFKEEPIPGFHEGWRWEDPLDAVLSTCSSLVSVVDEEGVSVIQFSHFSVKEFLMSERLAETNDKISRRYHISLTSAHTVVAQACLGILLHLDGSVTEGGLEKFPLADYAAEHWVDHARFENVSANAEEGMKQLFDPRKRHLGIWLWIYDPELDLWERNPRDGRSLTPRGTALHYAALCGLERIVEHLVIAHSQDVHSRAFGESTALHEASRRGHIEVVRILLELGADPTAQDKDGETPLHSASRMGKVEAIRVLLELGADPTAQDKYGETPLHSASRMGKVEAIRVLLELGADPTAQDKNGETPLHSASLMGEVEAIRVLLELGADPTAQDKDGMTPLHSASQMGKVEAIRMLLELGADPTAQDKGGRHHCTLRRGWEKWKPFGCFSSWAQIRQHKTSTARHHCTLCHPAGAWKPFGCFSSWAQIRQHKTKTAGHHCTLRRRWETWEPFGCFSSGAQIRQHKTRTARHLCTLRRRWETWEPFGCFSSGAQIQQHRVSTAGPHLGTHQQRASSYCSTASHVCRMS
jgi:ankyrin repeat protein